MAERRGGRGGRRRHLDPARGLAFDVLRQVNGEGRYANLALAKDLGQADLDTRDAGFATELVFGTLRLQGTYDHIIAAAAGRPLASLQPALVDVLRLAAHQLLGLGLQAHAAVASSVDLAALRIGERVAGITNAIVRRIAARSLAVWLDELTTGLGEQSALALRTGHPEWIVAAFADLLPPDELGLALAADNVPAVPTLVIRPGLAEVRELLDEHATPTAFSPYGATRPGNPAQVPAVVTGRAGVQDEGSQLVVQAAVAAPRTTGPWLDLCAGPGGKSALLRGLAAQAGEFLVAADRHEHRAKLVASALRAYPATGHTVVCADGVRASWRPDAFGLVLADVPCSGIGALRRRPEARWRHPETIIEELAPLQRGLLDTAIEVTRPGGVIAYATCSPHRAETFDIVTQALAHHDVDVLDAPALLPKVPNATASTDPRFLQLWPHRHGTDAMFLALLAKR